MKIAAGQVWRRSDGIERVVVCIVPATTRGHSFIRWETGGRVYESSLVEFARFAGKSVRIETVRELVEGEPTLPRPYRIERAVNQADMFPGKFRIRRRVGGHTFECVAGDEAFLLETIAAALNDEAARWWISFRTGEVFVGGSNEPRLIVTYVGPARVRRTA